MGAAEEGRYGELYFYGGDQDVREGDVWVSYGLFEEGRPEGWVGAVECEGGVGSAL